MWSNVVKVASRRYSDGAADAHVLEFVGGISHRPVLRKARSGELPIGLSTRVSLEVSEEVAHLISSPSEGNELSDMFRMSRPIRRIPRGISGAEHIVAALAIPVYLDVEGQSRLINMPNWEKATDFEFVSYFSKHMGDLSNLDRVAELLTEVVSDGKVRGKALLAPPFADEAMKGGLLIHDKGITISTIGHPLVFGVLDGRPATAARDTPSFDEPVENEAWLQAQKSLLLAKSKGDSEPPRESWRLQLLREWSHEQVEQVFP